MLRPDQLGCTIGGGTGLRYSYIDLALTDVPRSAEIIRRVLQEGNIPKRSWLQFFDCEWRQEWIGIWDDSPPPPMPADEVETYDEDEEDEDDEVEEDDE